MADQPVEAILSVSVDQQSMRDGAEALNNQRRAWEQLSGSMERVGTHLGTMTARLATLAGAASVGVVVNDLQRMEVAALRASVAVGNLGAASQLKSAALGSGIQYGIPANSVIGGATLIQQMTGGDALARPGVGSASMAALARFSAASGLDVSAVAAAAGTGLQASHLGAGQTADMLSRSAAYARRGGMAGAIGDFLSGQAQIAGGFAQAHPLQSWQGSMDLTGRLYGGLARWNPLFRNPSVAGGAISAVDAGVQGGLTNPRMMAFLQMAGVGVEDALGGIQGPHGARTLARVRSQIRRLYPDRRTRLIVEHSMFGPQGAAAMETWGEHGIGPDISHDEITEGDDATERAAHGYGQTLAGKVQRGRDTALQQGGGTLNKVLSPINEFFSENPWLAILGGGLMASAAGKGLGLMGRGAGWLMGRGASAAARAAPAVGRAAVTAAGRGAGLFGRGAATAARAASRAGGAAASAAGRTGSTLAGRLAGLGGKAAGRLGGLAAIAEALIFPDSTSSHDDVMPDYITPLGRRPQLIDPSRKPSEAYREAVRRYEADKKASERFRESIDKFERIVNDMVKTLNGRAGGRSGISYSGGDTGGMNAAGLQGSQDQIGATMILASTLRGSVGSDGGGGTTNASYPGGAIPGGGGSVRAANSKMRPTFASNARAQGAIARGASGPDAHYRRTAAAVGAKYKVDPNLLLAIAEIETNYGRDTSTSSKGAVGPMQFMPDTWRSYGHGTVYNLENAMDAAARYLLDGGLRRGNEHDALYSYNHSEDYVTKVQAAKARLVAASSGGQGRAAFAAGGQAVVNVYLDGARVQRTVAAIRSV